MRGWRFAEPVGLEYVVSGLVAVDQPGVDANQAHSELAAELDSVEATADGGAVLHDWPVEIVPIDGVGVEARVRDIGDTRRR